jgi:hypothetical protein
VKSLDEQVREKLAATKPEDALRALAVASRRRNRVSTPLLDLGLVQGRAVISEASQPLLEAVQRILADLRDYWPLSLRQIHYNLLNNPPPRARKRGGQVVYYENTQACSSALSRLLTIARIAGSIDETAIQDETRSTTLWEAWPNPGAFVDELIEEFANRSYWRQRMVSLPHHIEILIEKLTVMNMVSDVACEYGIPITPLRGIASLPPRIAIKDRYEASGKRQRGGKLLLILVTDFDPSGRVIAKSLPRSLRDDYEINVIPVQAALTLQQVQTLPDLPESRKRLTDEGKPNTHYAKWEEEFGPEQGAFELEAIFPATLQRLVREQINQVIDRDAYNREVAAMAEDAREIMAWRTVALGQLRKIKLPRGRK